jgi:membrane-bound lytic murein transglycosylase D
MLLKIVIPFLAGCLIAGAEPPASPSSTGTEAPPARQIDDSNLPAASDELFEAGKALFDEYAPPEVKAQFDFPTKEQWDAFAVRLQRALDGDSFQELGDLEPEIRAALAALQTIPDYQDYSSWLSQKAELASAAHAIAQQRQPTPDEKAVPPKRPAIPQYDLWLQKLKGSSMPARASALLPVLTEQFSSAGIPKNLLWLAEVESGFDPSARNPSGAKGLYQLMPETAKDLGLSTWMPDERSHPAKSARAAAALLGRLYSKFGDWPLAIAAYNAGEGRVRRALEKRKAKTFGEIASALSVETRLYVPKVLATIETRTGGLADVLGEAKL